jgi:hypothetical protein
VIGITKDFTIDLKQLIVREVGQLISEGTLLPELKKIPKRKAINESSKTVTISSDVEEPNLSSK